jgi:flagellar motility protein MotE (MotC chaperone)
VRILAFAGLFVTAPAIGRAAVPEATVPKSVDADTASKAANVGKSDVTGKSDVGGRSGAGGKSGAAGKPGAAGKSGTAGKSDSSPAVKAERGTSTEAVEAAPDKVAAPANDNRELKAAKPRAHKSAGSSAGPDKPRIGEGPSPASPPPMTMSGLHDEVHHEAAPGKIDPASAPRTKVEQMLAEITRARESLHDDTARLEAMMMQDVTTDPSASGASASPGQPAKTVAKNPLDVLAKALRGIKPEQAAPIVARLDRRLAANVLLHMPPIDAGKIMGALKPETAAELATQITLRAPHSEQKR